ncbi:hypothetical protein SARC_08259, partial [Sphaeroforma arctica JP610]
QGRHVRWALSVEKDSQAKNAIKNQDDFANFLDRARVGKERRNNVKLHKHRSKGISEEANERFNAHYSAMTRKDATPPTPASHDRRSSMDAAINRAADVPKLQLSERACSELPRPSANPNVGQLSYAQVADPTLAQSPNSEPSMRAIITRTTSITSIKYNPSIEYLTAPFSTGHFVPSEGFFTDDEGSHEGCVQSQSFGTRTVHMGVQDSLMGLNSHEGDDACVDRAVGKDSSRSHRHSNSVKPRGVTDSSMSMQRISSYTFGKEGDEKYSMESHDDYGKPGTSSGTWNGTTGMRTNSFRNAVQAQAVKSEYLSVANREVTPGPMPKRKGRFSVTPKLDLPRSPPLSPRRTLSEQATSMAKNSNSTGTMTIRARPGSARKFKVSPVVAKDTTQCAGGTKKLGFPVMPDMNRAHTSQTPTRMTLSKTLDAELGVANGVDGADSGDRIVQVPQVQRNTHALPVRPALNSHASALDDAFNRPSPTQNQNQNQNDRVSTRTLAKNTGLESTSPTQRGAAKRPPSPLRLKVSAEYDYNDIHSPQTPSDIHMNKTTDSRQDPSITPRILEHAPSTENVTIDVTKSLNTTLSPRLWDGREIPVEQDKSPSRKTKSHSRRHSTGKAFKGLVKLARSASAYTGVGSSGNMTTGSPHTAKRTNSDLDNTTVQVPEGSINGTGQWESKDVKSTRETDWRRRSSGTDVFESKATLRKQPVRRTSERDKDRSWGRSYQQIFSPSKWGKSGWGSLQNVNPADKDSAQSRTDSINRKDSHSDEEGEAAAEAGEATEGSEGNANARDSMEAVLLPPEQPTPGTPSGLSVGRRNSDLHLATTPKHTRVPVKGLMRSDSDSGVLGASRLDVSRDISEESTTDTDTSLPRNTKWRLIQTRLRAFKGSSSTSFRAQVDRNNSTNSSVDKIHSLPNRTMVYPLESRGTKIPTEMRHSRERSKDGDKGHKDDNYASDNRMSKLFRSKSSSNSTKEGEVQENGRDRGAQDEKQKNS